MTRFTIYTYLFKPINEPQEPDMFSPLVKVEESLARKQELIPRKWQAIVAFLDKILVVYA